MQNLIIIHNPQMSPADYCQNLVVSGLHPISISSKSAHNVRIVQTTHRQKI